MFAGSYTIYTHDNVEKMTVYEKYRQVLMSLHLKPLNYTAFLGRMGKHYLIYDRIFRHAALRKEPLPFAEGIVIDHRKEPKKRGHRSFCVDCGRRVRTKKLPVYAFQGDDELYYRCEEHAKVFATEHDRCINCLTSNEHCICGNAEEWS